MADQLGTEADRQHDDRQEKHAPEGDEGPVKGRIRRQFLELLIVLDQRHMPEDS